MFDEKTKILKYHHSKKFMKLENVIHDDFHCKFKKKDNCQRKLKQSYMIEGDKQRIRINRS